MGTQVPPVPALDAIPVSVAQGGTASTTPSAARTALGLAIGSDVNAYNAFATAMDQSVAAGAAPALAVTNTTGTRAGIDSSATSHAADTGNPHATDIGNLGSGTLAELNTAVTDATLDTSTAARPLYTGGSVNANKAAAVADLGVGGLTFPSSWSGWSAVAVRGGRVVHQHQMADVADLISTPGDMVWTPNGETDSSAKLDSAVIASGVMTWTYGIDAADQGVWTVGTHSCPSYGVELPAMVSSPGSLYRSVCHIAAPDAASMVDGEYMGILFSEDGDRDDFNRIDFRHTAGAMGLNTDAGGSVAFTDDEAVTGVWLRQTYSVVSGSATVSVVEYKKGAVGVGEPAESEWTLLGSVQSNLIATTSSVWVHPFQFSNVASPTDARMVVGHWHIELPYGDVT